METIMDDDAEARIEELRRQIKEIRDGNHVTISVRVPMKTAKALDKLQAAWDAKTRSEVLRRVLAIYLRSGAVAPGE